MSELKETLDFIRNVVKGKKEQLQNFREDIFKYEKKLAVLEKTKEVSSKEFYSNMSKYFETDEITLNAKHNEPIVVIKKGFYLSEDQINLAYKYLIDVYEIKPKIYSAVIEYKIDGIDFCIEKLATLIA